MKKTMTAIAGCLVTLCLIFWLTAYFGHLLDPASSEGSMSAIKAFHQLEENSAEVLVYGSSVAWKGFDPAPAYRNYGLAAYNYGNNWQALNTTLLFLQDSLRTQTPKVACIETYRVGMIKENTNMDGQIYYTRMIPDFEGKREYLRQCFGDNVGRYLSYLFPLAMFHDNWNIISKENFSVSDPETYLRQLGYARSSAVYSAQVGDYRNFPQQPLPEKSVEVLDKMVAACREKGVEIVFYTCPFEGEYSYFDAMEQYARDNGCVYLNLFAQMEEVGIDPAADFRDYGHLNDSGAGKVANFLGEYISSHYDVTDLRTVPGNFWERMTAE